MYLAVVLVLSIIRGKLAYKTERTFFLNGKLYKEVHEQPWFRVEHEHHVPIPAAMVNESGFGKHSIPEDDIYVEHDWTEEEKKYLPCLDLLCVCPYYGGKVSGSKCVLPNGKVLQKAIRKEPRQMSDSERIQIAIAFNRMKAAGLYDRIGFVHKYSGLHEGPGFFTWHREYLKRFELVFRRFLPPGSRLGLPYWDSALESELPDPRESLFFSSLFVGAANATGHIINGPFSDWNIMEGTRRLVRFMPNLEYGEVLNNARIDFILEQKKIENVLAAVLPVDTCKILISDDRLLSYSHDYVHFFIGGDMFQTYSSTSEPIFYYHHPMIDYIWEMWRQLRQTRQEREQQWPPPYPDCYPPTHFLNASLKELDPLTNKDVISNKYTDNMYEYSKRSTCSKENWDCGSKYLFCHMVEGYPQCMAKLRIGAICKGFEDTPICYEGRCLDGRCVRTDPDVGPDPKDFM
ncbi:common central domain of tyrosinase [Ancylostoma caninum]|uniref:Common central domain of tyrosinase n=1 Tax=Ancylostoma caninum TaxID=29170 RepID=A0A368G9U5_ANCCA|nr:common central domain of tyrosinase [Ancylostoma caninum]